jgi:hypothetical protein
LDVLGFFVDLVEEGDEKGACFARSILGPSDNAFACDDEGYGFFLDWGRH